MLTTFALISQATGLEKGSGEPNSKFVADLRFDQLISVAKKKRAGIYASSLKTAVREVLGTCQSAGVTVNGRPAKEVQEAIKAGEFDSQLIEAE
jgi:large subunit ribosomal protein L11